MSACMHVYVCCLCQVASVPILGKMAGAVGNYNAHMSAYADVDWQDVAEKFVTGVCGEAHVVLKVEVCGRVRRQVQTVGL